MVKFLIETYLKFGPNEPVNDQSKKDEKRNFADYLNATDKDDMTPLMRAAMEGHDNVVKHFLTLSDINIVATDTRGRTALVIAVDAMTSVDGEDEQSSEPDQARAEVIRLLVEHDDKKKNELLEEQDEIGRKTYRVKSEMEWLVNISDNDKRTALIVAAGNGLKDVCLCLIEKGANVNMRKKDGSTAIKKAAVWRHQSVVDLLRSKGAVFSFEERYEYRSVYSLSRSCYSLLFLLVTICCLLSPSALLSQHHLHICSFSSLH